MASWLVDQWKQIRGHLKYELLRTVALFLAGSGIIAACGEMLHKRFQGVDSDWFVFGAIFCCSLLVFALSLLRLAPKLSDKKCQPSNRLKIDALSETMHLGALWTVPTTIYYNLSIELLEIANENEVTIELSSHSIQYVGANVKVVQKRLGLGAGRYILQRASVAYGDDCICHWEIGESSFRGFYVFLSHANKFAHEATIGVYAIDAYMPVTESAGGAGPHE
jgi:hypothetical protein